MTKQQIREERQKTLSKIEYKTRWWQGWNYSILRNIYMEFRTSSKDFRSYSDAIIMADTETSKISGNIRDENGKYIAVENFVVAWTISIRVYGKNLVTLYGKKPSDFTYCLNLIRKNIKADTVYVYFHNLAYDWVFLRKFLFERFGYPVKALNVKPHYPIAIEFDNGIVLKDSLILAQKKLEKWADDMDVEHKKAVGSWDYDKIRDQSGRSFSEEELHYIESDTLAGVECLEKTMQALNKTLVTLPYTATGIPREQTRKRGRGYKAHKNFLKIESGLIVQELLEKVFHGGYVHANRHWLDTTLTKEILGDYVECFDFSSSYPFCMLAYKFPSSKFARIKDCHISDILKKADSFAFIFKLILIKPVLKDYGDPMPALQLSKCVKVINPVCDNGRILCCDYCEIYLNEIDLEVIAKHYKWKQHICTDVYFAEKDYLPKYFRNYIFELYEDKTTLKGLDPINYMIRKGTLNSCYGMCVQKPIKADIQEDYETGACQSEDLTEEELKQKYDDYIKKQSSILPFCWGVWVTSYAFRNLFALSECCKDHIYSDTDSVYGANWDMEKVEAYNNHCKELIRASGYGPVMHKGREYWLGIAEHDGDNDTYTEFRVQGAKRYAGRCLADGKIHLTVSGVPKGPGAECLKNDLNNFKPGFNFKGEETGKKTHTYFFKEDIEIRNGIEMGDSIDLTPCDYLLDGVVEVVGWEDLISEEIYMPTFGQEDLYE